MMATMARGGHGPLHMGATVTLEGDARFDMVAFVYYPGVQYFHNLAGNTFFRNIIGDKQLWGYAGDDHGADPAPAATATLAVRVRGLSPARISPRPARGSPSSSSPDRRFR